MPRWGERIKALEGELDQQDWSSWEVTTCALCGNTAVQFCPISTDGRGPHSLVRMPPRNAAAYSEFMWRVSHIGRPSQGMARPNGWHPVGPWPGYKEAADA